MAKLFRADIDNLRAHNNGAAARLRRRQEKRREALVRILADGAGDAEDHGPKGSGPALSGEVDVAGKDGAN